MHVCLTTGAARPLLKLVAGGTDGAVDESGRVTGCYIHGLLADDRQRRHWLERIGAASTDFDYESGIETTLDRLAEHIEQHMDLDRLYALARVPNLTSAR